MIGKLSVQLYPYSKLSKQHLLDAIKIAESNGINGLEGTSAVLNTVKKEGLENVIDCVHITNWKQLIGTDDNKRKKIIPSLIHEKDFVFPFSLMQKIITRNTLHNIGNLVFKEKKRRIFFDNLSTKNYSQKEYWVEVTSWLNAQKTQMVLHNHAMEFIPFVESETPWEIIHHYCTPEIRFQFDPKNIKDKSEIEEILIKFNQRIDSIHFDLDDNRLTSDQKEFILEYCKVLNRPIDLIIEQSRPDLNRLDIQIKKIKQILT